MGKSRWKFSQHGGTFTSLLLRSRQTRTCYTLAQLGGGGVPEEGPTSRDPGGNPASNESETASRAQPAASRVYQQLRKKKPESCFYPQAFQNERGRHAFVGLKSRRGVRLQTLTAGRCGSDPGRRPLTHPVRPDRSIPASQGGGADGGVGAPCRYASASEDEMICSVAAEPEAFFLTTSQL